MSFFAVVSQTSRLLTPVAVPALLLSFGAGVNGQSDTDKAGAAQTAADTAPLPVAISPLDSRIRYMGRFDSRDPAGPRCDWSASTVTFTFAGSALNVKLKDDGNNEYQIVLDNKPTQTLPTKAGSNLYTLFRANKSQVHTIALIKRTEARCGVTQFQGFQLSEGGKLLSPPPSGKHRIEVIGDSITCGYGNEGKSNKEHFSSATENAYLTYGAIAARNFGADYSCLAWSGRKMWPNNTMGEVYDRALATNANSTWNFGRWTPEVVVVALATNDFAGGAPDKAGWIAGYQAFLQRIHTHYPKAAVYCATSPMMFGEQVTTLKSYLKQIIFDQQAAGYKNVRILEFETQNPANGYGADWHPNVKTQTLMAEKLSQALQQDLNWKPIANAATGKATSLSLRTKP